MLREIIAQAPVPLHQAQGMLCLQRSQRRVGSPPIQYGVFVQIVSAPLRLRKKRRDQLQTECRVCYVQKTAFQRPGGFHLMGIQTQLFGQAQGHFLLNLKALDFANARPLNHFTDHTGGQARVLLVNSRHQAISKMFAARITQVEQGLFLRFREGCDALGQRSGALFGRDRCGPEQRRGIGLGDQGGDGFEQAVTRKVCADDAQVLGTTPVQRYIGQNLALGVQ